MSVPPFPPPPGWTKEKKLEQEQKRIRDLWLVPGGTYTYETNRILKEWGVYFDKYRWSCYIKRLDNYQGIIALESNFRTKWGAEKWGRDYLKRGGPPDDYWEISPRKPDARVIVYGRENG